MPELEDNAIVKDSAALNKKIKAVPNPNGEQKENSILDMIAEVGINSQVDINKLNQFTRVSTTRDQIYTVIDEMAKDPIISAILETYAEDATEYNDQGRIVWVHSDDPKVNAYVDWLLKVMEIDKNTYNWIYGLCKYGDIYFERFTQSEYEEDNFFIKEEQETLNEELKLVAYNKNDKFVNYIDIVPNVALMFELSRFGKTRGYVKTDINTLNKSVNMLGNINDTYLFNNQFKFKRNDVTLYPSNKFVHATLTDNANRTPEELTLFADEKAEESNKGITYKVIKGSSLLSDVFKIWRELSLLENSMLLNRITKSAIVRLINIEVGDMPKENVGPHLQGIKSLMEQKASINVGNSMTEYTNPGPIENNIYVPTYNGLGAITTTQIGGDVNISQLPDIEYFQNKFFGALRVPKQYFGLTDDGAGFNGGQSLAIISSRYAKMVKRIQSSYLQAITTLINLNLIDRGLDSYIGKFTLHMQPPTTQEEIDRRDNTSSKVQIVSDIMNLLTDVEDPIIKTKILKSLISTIISDQEVISLIDEQIQKLEDEGETNLISEEKSLESDSLDLDIGSNRPLDLDNELDLNIESEEDIEETLPNPEELGVGDLSDNNIEI